MSGRPWVTGVLFSMVVATPLAVFDPLRAPPTLKPAVASSILVLHGSRERGYTWRELRTLDYGRMGDIQPSAIPGVAPPANEWAIILGERRVFGTWPGRMRDVARGFIALTPYWFSEPGDPRWQQIETHPGKDVLPVAAFGGWYGLALEHRYSWVTPTFETADVPQPVFIEGRRVYTWRRDALFGYAVRWAALFVAGCVLWMAALGLTKLVPGKADG